MKYTDGYNTFNNYEEAYEDCQQSMRWEDYEEYFEDSLGFHKFFERVKKLPGFFEEFEDDFFEAETCYFEKNYSEIDDEGEEG